MDDAGTPPSLAEPPTEPAPIATLQPSPVSSLAAFGPIAPLPPPASLGPPTDPAPSTRRLIGASFDLLSRSTEEMRRASFYIGAILLGTGSAYALAAWWLEVASVHNPSGVTESALSGALGYWMGLLVLVGVFGLIVAAVESRALAAAILGGQAAGRPVTVRSALARSRATFWRVVLASVIVAIPVGLSQGAATAMMVAILPQASELSTAVTVMVGTLVGAPLAYLLTGIVLGDVDAFESTRRSFRVFGARKAAALVVALSESVALILILLGVSAGLDIALRVLDALGLGVHSGIAGIALTSLAIAAGAFALGTLLFTVTAISIAPQVVMFVGLTHATMGLDHVRSGGDRDPETRHAGQRPFRRFTRPMRAGFVLAFVGLIGSLIAIHAFPG